MFEASVGHCDNSTVPQFTCFHYFGPVQASAGALKLLQADMVERKGAAEVSREGQMDARERLIRELESSAKRAQQVQRFSEIPIADMICSRTRLDHGIVILPILVSGT